MIKNFLNKYWQVLLINILVLVGFILGYGHFGNIIVDSFREIYIPSQMLEGQALYKNIFSIYAPLSYFINAFLFLIFGVKLKIAYFAGFIAAATVINLTYKIATKFLPKNCALALTLFFFSVSALTPSVFNLYFPYSFGILYGLAFILTSIYFALKKSYPLAYLFYSLAICTKYEFLLFLPVLIFMSGKKDFWKNLGAFLSPIVLTLVALRLSGSHISDLIISLKLISAMTSSKTLYWFYSVTGLTFRWELIPIYLVDLIKIAVPVAILYFVKKYWIIPIVFIYLYYIANQELLVFAFPLILILFAIKFKSLTRDEKLIIIASILLSAKVFFATTLESYGVFFIPFALISIFILTPEKLRKSLYITLILCSIIFGIKNIQGLSHKNIKLKTEVGTVYTEPYYGETMNELIAFIEKNSSPNDKILVLPEGLSINVLTQRKSDNKFYSLIPLYTETFGEDLIIKRLEYKKPRYIAVSNYDTSSYYYRGFGFDYAIEIQKFINRNYTVKTHLGKDFQVLVFETNHPSP